MNASTERRIDPLQWLPNWPLELWMVSATVVLGLLSGATAHEFVAAFNTGWGRALGEFALILLPSFALAAALSQQAVAPAEKLAGVIAPVAGAGMICPDTAYASLSPIAGPRKLSVAFGSYAGFKLLIPAGPLLVATGLGVTDDAILFVGFALLLPVWAVGVAWARWHDPKLDTELPAKVQDASTNQAMLTVLTPFLILAGLIALGVFIDQTWHPVLDFLTTPKGALLCAALWAVMQVPRGQRRACLDSAVSRTGSLLLIIGAASAFGAMLTAAVPIAGFVTPQAGVAGVISLFALAAIFKLVQGSSMATFAAVAPVAAPIVAASQMPEIVAVFAICLGSFVAILPNDSFYWLVRKDSLANMKEGRTIALLTGGSVLQAFTGLVILLVLMTLGIL